MREILFKGKKKDNGEWIEGYLLDGGMPGEKRIFIGKLVIGKWTVMADEFDEVDTDTICQFTGLTDKNGKKIWESDIISYQRDNDDCPFPNKDTKKRFGKVFYQGFRSTFAIGMGKNGSKSINDDLWKYVQNGNRVEVIGNQFDNPELLQGSL